MLLLALSIVLLCYLWMLVASLMEMGCCEQSAVIAVGQRHATVRFADPDMGPPRGWFGDHDVDPRFADPDVGPPCGWFGDHDVDPPCGCDALW